MTSEDQRQRLVRAFQQAAVAVPTGQLERLWKTGRSAAGMAASMLGNRWRSEQAASEAELAAVGALVTQLGELKGVAMKAGQMMSFLDPSLADDVRRTLSLLQTQAPATPLGAVQETLRAELGPAAEELLTTLEPTPVAVASIGQVHRARLTDGTPVAVKVLHPGVEDALAADFRTAGRGGALAALVLPHANVAGFVDEARTVFLRECDLREEARAQQQYGTVLAQDADLRVPPVEPRLSTRRVLTTHWMPGPSLQEALDANPPQALRDAWGRALFRAYVGTLYTHGLFHADPHPGNYAFLPDGRVVLYDFGCVRAFAPAQVVQLVGLADATRRRDAAAAFRALQALGSTGADTPEHRALALEMLRRFWGPMLEPGARAIPPDGAVEAAAMMRDKRHMARLGLPPSMLFLMRIRFGLYAVLARLGSVVDWSALEAGWARGAGHPAAPAGSSAGRTTV